MLHDRSLAVKEQFYLAWPILLVGLFLITPKMGLQPSVPLTVTVLLLLAVFFAYCVVLTSVNQPLAFFGTLTRLWQLLTGALLATAVAQGLFFHRSVAVIVGPLGLAVIMASYFTIDPEWGFPGWMALLPVASAGALIYAGSSGAVSSMKLGDDETGAFARCVQLV